MDCETALPLIEALCDDELDVATAARLVAHCDACPGCAAVRRDVETRRSALREARPVDRLPDGVRERLVRGVGRSAPQGPGRGARLSAALGAAGLLAVLGLAGWVLRRPHSVPRPALSEAPVVREVSGEVFCLRCALSRLFPDTPVLDDRHLPVLRTEEGEIITLLDGSVTEAALVRKGCAARRVVLTVRLFPRQELAEVLEVRLLGPATGVPPREVVSAAAARAAGPRP